LIKLKKLNLSESRINDDGVKLLKPLTELEDLNLSQTEITPATLEQIVEFKKLQKLTISFCTMITSDAKETLQKAMPDLKIIGP
jgi:Leucine-rich repeat (LRR) protein